MNTDVSKQAAPESPFPVSQANDSGKAHPADSGKPQVVERLEQGAHQTIKQLADDASTHVKQVQQTFSNASDSVQQKAQLLKEAGDEWVECLRVTVQEKPLTAVATALALGLLVARLGR